MSARSSCPEADRPIKPLAGKIRTFAGALTGTAGKIRTFQDNLEPDAGKIRTFAGNIAGLAGKIRTFQTQNFTTTGVDPNFWGSLQPLSGSLAASAGKIRTFAGAYEAQAGKIRTFAGKIRTFTTDTTSAKAMLTEINKMVSSSEATWGSAVQQQTGKSFYDGYACAMLMKYHIDLKNSASLSTLDEATLELFLMDWYDNLMNFSGVDQTDYWMPQVGWTPAMTQQLSGGYVDAKIGVLDFTIGGVSEDNVALAKGISTVDGGHGTAVAGLIAAPHDGRGVMGIAPTASIVSYNPFDETMTAGWADIRTGLAMFADERVSVVNVSLGVPGWTLNEGWNEVFAKEDSSGSGSGLSDMLKSILDASKRQLFVLAAGNDGVVQPSSIEWSKDNPELIVVGSVDPNNVISQFSNTPGTTCLLTDGKCSGSASLLMNRFLVAPGEFILVDDGQGGVTRMSGTSFSAPLVSGTAALIVDRWPWLQNTPGDISGIILNSATDLGAPGTDAVYGRGLLNVSKALAPLDFSKLQWKVRVGSTTTTYTASNMASTAIKNKATWETNSAYVTVYETTGKSFRDFAIPLSSKLVGKDVGSSQNQFMAYLQSRFWNWAQTTASGGTSTGFAAFTDSGRSNSFRNLGALQASLTMRPRALQADNIHSGTRFDSALALQTPDGKVRFSIGSGQGAAMLHGMTGFAMNSDFDLQSGGTNPYLGLASGSSYASIDYRMGERATISAGFTHRDAQRDRQSRAGNLHLPLAYKASAYQLKLSYKANDWMAASMGYTMLDEQGALLGMQSADPSDFSDGSRTDSATIGLELTPSEDIAIGASATLGRTRQGDSSKQNLTVAAGGIASTSFQVALAKTKVLSSKDSLRLSVSQPLHVESGSIEFSGVEVIDRQTGELGVVTQHIGLKGAPRAQVAEGIYRLPLMGGNAELNLFGKYRLGRLDQNAAEARATAGVSFNLRF